MESARDKPPCPLLPLAFCRLQVVPSLLSSPLSSPVIRPSARCTYLSLNRSNLTCTLHVYPDKRCDDCDCDCDDDDDASMPSFSPSHLFLAAFLRRVYRMQVTHGIDCTHLKSSAPGMTNSSETKTETGLDPIDHMSSTSPTPPKQFLGSR